MKTPEQKIFVLEGSLTVFALGLLSLVPPLGLICAPIAMWRYFTLWSVAGKEWNPARPYLYYGLCASFLGGMVSLVALLAVVAVLIDDF
jgi:hypothetical protein